MTTTWVAAFRSAVIDPTKLSYNEPRSFADQTLRQILHLDGGGTTLRVRLSNRYGTAPLTVAAARVAVRPAAGKAAEIDPGTDTGLRFDGRDGTTVPAGGEVVSDPVELAVEAGTDLVLSLYLPEETGLATFSHQPIETGYVAEGDAVSATTLPGAREVGARFYVTGVDVLAPEGTTVAVAFGDSWFEGVGTTPGTNRRSPNLLNRRLARGWVVNQGIAGNRLLTDEVGEHGLARFDRDVLQVPGVSHVLINFGINDLGLPGLLGQPSVTAEEIVAGFTELARRSHEAGLRILVATVGPFADSVYSGMDSPEVREIRRTVNAWIRDTDVFDGVFDVAAAVQDPQRPDHLRAEFDSGDHMHLNDAGAQAMADTVDVGSLTL
ncbi:GDSL-type esterase/lipase family protein [Streptosporangium saharense]|uniref:GDSL-type esterase/lipase family protein n=1 Tax=Streptosporangium saharense TaxID=1706840 RepID=UPI0034292A83